MFGRIRWHLVGWTMLVVGVILVLLGGAVYTAMSRSLLAQIDRGDANAILCWDIDRLYRNPVDEGRVRWLLQQGVIREIRTPHRVFYPQDAQVQPALAEHS